MEPSALSPVKGGSYGLICVFLVTDIGLLSVPSIALFVVAQLGRSRAVLKPPDVPGDSSSELRDTPGEVVESEDAEASMPQEQQQVQGEQQPALDLLHRGNPPQGGQRHCNAPRRNKHHSLKALQQYPNPKKPFPTLFVGNLYQAPIPAQ